MGTPTLLLLIAFATIGAYYIGRERATELGNRVGPTTPLHSLPHFYGYFLASCCLLPALGLLTSWSLVEVRVLLGLLADALPADVAARSDAEQGLWLNSVRSLSDGSLASAFADEAMQTAAAQFDELKRRSMLLRAGATLSLVLFGGLLGFRRLRVDFRARNSVESLAERFLIGASGIALLTTVGIVVSVLFEAMRFFQEVPLTEFFFGLEWSPQTAIRSDQVGSTGRFGIVPLVAGTLLITTISMLVAVPIGLFGAIYMTEYASRRTRAIAKPLLETLAGIPTVVYGFFAVLTVAPFVRSAGAAFGIEVASESALTAGLVMGIMIIPLVSSLSDDAIRAVPTSLREGALALGATRAETIVHVVLPAAVPGVAGGIMLAVSRAIGETMIVVMAAGLAANLTANPFEAVTTVTVQIVTLLVGDQEFDSAKTLAAFALGLVLFVITMALNVAGLRFVRRFRSQYV